MSAHVSEELTALLDGELSSAERERVERHLGECAACATERDRLQAALGSLARIERVEPSPALRRKVLMAIAAEPERPWARLRSFLSARVLVPAAAVASAAAVLMLVAHNPDKGSAAAMDLGMAERLDLLQDYDVVASSLPADVNAADMDVVAHLHELGE